MQLLKMQHKEVSVTTEGALQQLISQKFAILFLFHCVAACVRVDFQVGFSENLPSYGGEYVPGWWYVNSNLTLNAIFSCTLCNLAENVGFWWRIHPLRTADAVAGSGICDRDFFWDGADLKLTYLCPF